MIMRMYLRNYQEVWLLARNYQAYHRDTLFLRDD